MVEKKDLLARMIPGVKEFKMLNIEQLKASWDNSMDRFNIVTENIKLLRLQKSDPLTKAKIFQSKLEMLVLMNRVNLIEEIAEAEKDETNLDWMKARNQLIKQLIESRYLNEKIIYLQYENMKILREQLKILREQLSLREKQIKILKKQSKKRFLKWLKD